MEILILFFMFCINLSNSQLIDSEPQLVFNIYHKDIHIVKLEKLKSSINYAETDLLVNTTGVKTLIADIDYSITANILIWRKIEPENALYVFPIDKSKSNLLGIRDKTLLLKLNKSTSIRVAIDWIHNLVYYNEKNQIIVFNITYPNPEFGFVIVSDTGNTILDLCINPLDSLIFWSDFDNIQKKGRIMRASQDGSNKTALIDSGIKEPITLAIDLVLRKVFWIDRSLFRFSSIDFNGNDIQTILTSRDLFTLSYFIAIFGDDIYWSNYFHSSILKTNKFGLNGTQINYLVKSETDAEIESIKIIHSSLQPNSTNRCIHAKCSHLCLPVSHHQYRCVCPNLIYNTRNNRVNCKQSTHTTQTTQEKQTTLHSMITLTPIKTNVYTTLMFEETYRTTDSFRKNLTISGTSAHQSIEPDIDISAEELKMRTDVTNECNFLTNSSRFQKTFYIKNYQTSKALYVLLIISIIFNILTSFGLIFKLYRRRKRQRNIRIGAQRCLAEFKPIQFEMINNDNNYQYDNIQVLIQSNPLISNTVLVRNDLNEESNLHSL